MRIVVYAPHFAEYSMRLALALSRKATVLLVLERRNRALECSESLDSEVRANVTIVDFRVKVRDEGMVRNKAVYVALGVRPDGTKEILGLWIEQTEGAKFWLRVMNELKNRGVEDVLIAVVDGLKGFPDAITAAFPQTQVQTCIVHLIRNSLDFVSYKDRKAVAAALKQIYRAKDAVAGEEELNAFAEGLWGRKYPAIAQSWRRHWSEVIPFYAFPDEVRRIIYTTDEMDKRFVSSRVIFFWRGRPRGEERSLGWKLRQAA